jgi:hypothetical protein
MVRCTFGNGDEGAGVVGVAQVGLGAHEDDGRRRAVLAHLGHELVTGLGERCAVVDGEAHEEAIRLRVRQRTQPIISARR